MTTPEISVGLAAGHPQIPAEHTSTEPQLVPSATLLHIVVLTDG